MDSNDANAVEGIAIIGMSGRFPEASSVDAFWTNIANGVESIRFFSDEELEQAGITSHMLQQPEYVKAKAILDHVECFDAAYFGMNPREAEIMDPQHRLFLEEAVHALENAGINPDQSQDRIGVYCSSSLNTYLLNNLYPNRQLIESVGVYQTLIGNDKDFLPSKVSYYLNLRGPSVAVQTACSSSLVSVHVACQSIFDDECDIALAGGVAVRVPQIAGYSYQVGGIHSPDGHCRSFDKNAKGTVSGNGLGIVVLKRVQDAIHDRDFIYAVIKGSAVNNDGNAKIGYTAPSVQGQASVIVEAQAMAEVHPDTIQYVETHGTATPLGDPIEIAALTKAFQTATERTAFCGIGSVKSNIGHLDAAAGVTGLIKATKALQHKQIPPSLHFQTANPELHLEESPFYVNTTCKKWKRLSTPRRAGVSSFGIGGTNAHVIIEEAPKQQPSGFSREKQVVVLSAKTKDSLKQMTANLASYLQENKEVPLSDVAYTLQTGRQKHRYTFSTVCEDRQSAIDSLEHADTFQEQIADPSVVWLFSGQGTQQVNMGKDLYQNEKIYQAAVDQCAEMLLPLLNRDIRSILYPAKEEEEPAQALLEQTEYAQIALFVMEYALAKCWLHWGVKPDAMVGHSLGEYVVACLAGVFSLEDALAVVAKRGQLMQQLEQGAMLSVYATVSDIKALIGEKISIASINGQRLLALSGTIADIENLETVLDRASISYRRLHTSHAFHSHMMDPILDEFAAFVATRKRQKPTINYVSSYTGTWIQADEAVSVSYWRSQLRETVQFQQALATLADMSPAVLLEIGPNDTLRKICKQAMPKNAAIFASLSSKQSIYHTLGALWQSGVDIDWQAYYAKEDRRRVPLPGYCFEQTKYWVYADQYQKTEQKQVYQTESLQSEDTSRTTTEQKIVQIWTDLLGVDEVQVTDDFFELGGHSLLATQVLSRLRAAFDIDIQLQDLFEASTLQQLAAIIDGYAYKPEDQQVQQILEEIKNLRPEEIEQLLQDESTRGNSDHE